jgi:hypothetical protein
MVPCRPARAVPATRRLLSALLAACAAAAGCGGVTAPAGSAPPPPPAAVSVSPASTDLFLGATQQFTATVQNAASQAVNWQVAGIPGGNATVGTITSAGLYTAPQVLPSPARVVISAQSQASPSAVGTAEVNVRSDVQVALAPAAASVELGAAVQFTETVTGSGNPSRAVSWSVNTIPGGDATVGTVSASGLYTAPRALPPGAVAVRATSVADPAKNAEAAVTVTSNLTVAITGGPAEVVNGASAQFTATVTPAPGSDPLLTVNWSVSGSGCSGSACGTIDSSGLYQAPAVAPNPPVVRITATSAADPSKSAFFDVTIRSEVVVTVTPASATVALEESQQFTAIVGGTTDQRVVWDVNGIPGGNETFGTVTNTPTDAGRYTAPRNMPAGGQVTVRAVSQFNPAVSGSAVVTLVSNIVVTVTPASATRSVNQRQRFTASVANSTNPAVEWLVNGVPGGSATAGLICVEQIVPCQPTTTGFAVDYLAPAAVPSPPEVTIEAVSQADPSKRGTAVVTIVEGITVAVTPVSAVVAPEETQQFTALVTGAINSAVTWSVTGAGCSGAACGTISAAGLYTAPNAAPSPNTVTVRATSVEDPSRSGTATVTIVAGVLLRTLRPSSLTAGTEGDVVLRVLGSGFAPGSGGAGATIVFAGTDRATNCPSTNECTTTLTAADYAFAGQPSVAVRNPDGTLSGTVSFVVAPAEATEDAFLLSAGTPVATGKDVAVTDASVLGSGAPALNVQFLGVISAGVCSGGVTTVKLLRPAAGEALRELCILGPGITAQNQFRLSGPEPNDLEIADVDGSLGSVVRLVIRVPAAALPGARTLLIENDRKDRTAVLGGIEVK